MPTRRADEAAEVAGHGFKGLSDAALEQVIAAYRADLAKPYLHPANVRRNARWLRQAEAEQASRRIRDRESRMRPAS